MNVTNVWLSKISYHLYSTKKITLLGLIIICIAKCASWGFVKKIQFVLNKIHMICMH
jgi:hypothetical protein